jgi:hypothetical protein
MTQPTDEAIAAAKRLAGLRAGGSTFGEIRSFLAHARSLDTITALTAKLAVAVEALEWISSGKCSAMPHAAAQALAQIGRAEDEQGKGNYLGPW